MTVAEMIEKLKALPSEAVCVVWNEGEWEPVGLVQLNKLGKVQIDTPYDEDIAP